MFPWRGWAIAACCRSRASLVAENLCLRQELLVLRRRKLRPRLSDSDRRFLDLGEPMVPGLARHPRRRECDHGATLAPSWLEGLLALAFETRLFLKRHAATISACDFFCVQTIFFRTLYVFLLIDHASRQVLHVHVTPHSSAEWTAQQIVECCAWDREPPRFLIHDRDSVYGAVFDRRVRNLGILQVRTRSDRLGPTQSRSAG